jgi:disulfide oxidoreductase YuzD
MKKLKRSIIKCNICGDVIESKYRHNWVQCKCKRIYIDGGLSYQRVGFQIPTDFTDMSEWEGVDEDYLYYVLKKKDNNVYLDDMDEETENLSDAYFTEGLQDMEFAKSIQDNPEVWEIKRIKVTYELLEGGDEIHE